jgi:hypothetical protein
VIVQPGIRFAEHDRRKIRTGHAKALLSQESKPGHYRCHGQRVVDLSSHHQRVRDRQGLLPAGSISSPWRSCNCVQASWAGPSCPPAMAREPSTQPTPSSALHGHASKGGRVPSNSNESQKTDRSNTSAETEPESLFPTGEHSRHAGREVSTWMCTWTMKDDAINQVLA